MSLLFDHCCGLFWYFASFESSWSSRTDFVLFVHIFAYSLAYFSPYFPLFASAYCLLSVYWVSSICLLFLLFSLIRVLLIIVVASACRYCCLFICISSYKLNCLYELICVLVAVLWLFLNSCCCCCCACLSFLWLSPLIGLFGLVVV